MILQKIDIFNKLGIKDTEDANRIFNLIMGFFAYMKVGDRISTSMIEFEKVDNNLLVVETQIKEDELLDDLDKLNIIRIPG